MVKKSKKESVNLANMESDMDKRLENMLIDSHTIVSLVRDCFKTKKDLNEELVFKTAIHIEQVKEQLFMLLGIQ